MAEKTEPQDQPTPTPPQILANASVTSDQPVEPIGGAIPDTPPPVSRPRGGLTVADVFRPHFENVRLREPLLVVLLTAALDYLLYMGVGGLSYAIAFLIVPTGIYLAAFGREQPRSLVVFAVCMVALSAQCAWQYNLFTVAVGVVTLVCSAVTLHTGRGDVPYLTYSFLPTCVSGLARWIEYCMALRRVRLLQGRIPATVILTVGIPVVVVAGFAWVFYLSNPILGDRMSGMLTWMSENLSTVWSKLSPSPARALFWLGCFWFLGSLVRPQRYALVQDAVWQRDSEEASGQGRCAGVIAYRTCLNTLLSVNVLFVFYNLFDAYYLAWRRGLPPGLNHSQYAHQGALWLTVALALSTFVLGAVFHGDRNFFPKVRTLRVLAWVWIAQNFMLAGWVFARLNLYIHYNGLTPMRIVGVYGTLVVMAGLVLITRKIRHARTLTWLLRKHLAALAAGIVVLCITPLDAITWRVNTPLILRLEIPRPAVQLTEQRISPEGLMLLTPLLEHPEPAIARGVAALLGRWYFTEGQWYVAPPLEATPERWTQYQLAEARCAHNLARFEARIAELVPDRNWAEALVKLRALSARWI